MLRRGQIVPGSVLFTEGKRKRSREQKRVKGPLDDPEAVLWALRVPSIACHPGGLTAVPTILPSPYMTGFQP